MKNRKIYSLCFAAVFVLLCLLPSAGILLFGSDPAVANETRSFAPRLYDSDNNFNIGILRDTGDWFADHFAFRNRLISAWSGIHLKLFGTSVQEQVIAGSSGMLYFADTLDDYMGCGMTDSELDILAHDLSLLNEYAASQGAKLLFTAAPNKSSLYPDAMPAYYPAGHESSNLARLPALLKGEGVAYADLYSALHAQDEMLYYRTDTHWTSRGAALAADVIMAGFEKSSAYFSAVHSVSVPHKGDLYDMLFPSLPANETDLTCPELSFKELSNAKGGEALRFSAEGSGTGKLRCWRDSFGIALYPYLADGFAEAEFLRSSSYNLSGLAKDGVSHVLIELVERNLNSPLENAPVFPAPERSPELPGSISGALSISAEAPQDGLYRGKLQPTGLTPGMRVLLSDGARSYECWLLCSGGMVTATALLPVDFTPSLALVTDQSGALLYSLN